jgi:two-component system, LytTR family, sensor kinase
VNRWIHRLRGVAIAAAAFSLVSLTGALSTFLRARSGEVALPPRWFWTAMASVPVWTLIAPAIYALSRRFPMARRRVARTLAVHLSAVGVLLLVDGAASWVLSHVVHLGRPLTYWQHLWHFFFIDVFIYAGVAAVEHAVRYYRLYVERRLRASELEAQLSRAQLQALQMQLRPHFLFNALNTIAGLVRVGDKQAAVTMIAGLGDLLRLLLRSDGAQEVPVRQELDLIERYLRIEQARFGEQLAVEVTVEPGLEEALVPNLILQPLVENAVRHGIGAAAANGRVSVVVERDGATLRLLVRDSGEARGEERDGGAGGIGLSNTRARLQRLYGDEHRFDLHHTAGGTAAVIEIPLRT